MQNGPRICHKIAPFELSLADWLIAGFQTIARTYLKNIPVEL